MGNMSLDVPYWVSPEISGWGGVGGHVVAPYDALGSGGGGGGFDYEIPAPSPAGPGPQTMAQALNPTPQTPTATDDGSLKINIDQQTLLIGLAVAAGLLFFATR